MATQEGEHSRARLVDDALVRLSLSTRLPGEVGIPWFQSGVFWLAGSGVEGFQAMRQRHGLPPDAARVVLPEPWDVGYVLRDQVDPQALAVHRCRRIPGARVGRLRRWGVTVPLVPGEACEVYGATLNRDGTFSCSRRLYYRNGDGPWEPAGGAHAPTHRIKTKVRCRGSRLVTVVREITGHSDEVPAVACAVGWLTPLYWQVAIRYPESPFLSLLTDATGVKALYRLRERPEGRDRRAALLHWVSEHWRQNRFDPDMEIEVRRHLRGATDFDWFGMNCRITPSRPDEETNEALARERRAKGVSLRPRGNRKGV